MNLRWFVSPTVRDATHMRKHVWKLLTTFMRRPDPPSETACFRIR